MMTNQKFHLLRHLTLISLLLFTLSSLGQNFISDLKRDGISEERLSIKITLPKGQPTDVVLSKKSPIVSGSILEVPSKTIVYITSLNGNIGQITGPNTVEFTATTTGEEYRVLEGKGTSNVFIKVFKQLTGGVLASGPTGEIHARSRLTEFLVAVDGDDSNFELIKGKIDINQRQKVEIKDENKIDSAKTRALFVTKTTQLNLKDSMFNYNDNDVKIKYLSADREIDKFFDEQIGQQKKTFTKAGTKAKQGFKYLDTGDLDKGTQLLEEAYKDGEIRLDFIIQSSLMLADAYFKNEDLKKSGIWMEAGLHFSDLFYKINKDKYTHFSKLGNNNIAKAYSNDLIVANEYFIWGYILKSRINGCLDNENENPSKYRREANQIKKEVSN
ncbi:hypothetical protein ACS386_06065 [Flavobacteriaceae bacterium LMO-SS05]